MDQLSGAIFLFLVLKTYLDTPKILTMFEFNCNQEVASKINCQPGLSPADVSIHSDFVCSCEAENLAADNWLDGMVWHTLKKMELEY